MKVLSLASLCSSVPDENRYFSAIATLSPEGRDLLVRSFFEFLNRVKEQVAPSPDEDVYQINFDFIQWTGLES